MTELDIALKAMQTYSAMHPRPLHVTQKQACEMMGKSEPTIRAMVRTGKLRLNDFGMIPITEIDRALEAKSLK